MTYRETFERMLTRYGLTWCKGGCHAASSHKHGDHIAAPQRKDAR